MTAIKNPEPQVKSGFGEELAKLRRAKNLTLEKVAALTKIQVRYLERLEQADFSKLPPDVYTRGMVIQYAKAVGGDPKELWSRFVQERKGREGEGGPHPFKTGRHSGVSDRLPQNRFLNPALFVLTPKWFTIFLAAVVLLVIVGYFFFQLEYLVGPPALAVYEPAGDALVTTKDIKLTGRVEAGATLTINGRDVSVGDDGRFTEDMELQPGINVIEFKAKNHLGKEAVLQRKLVWGVKEEPAATSSAENLSATSTSQ